MADQTVMWTVLPNGATGGADDRRLRLSVVVSPRLTSSDPSPTLAGFPDFLVWPDRLAAGQVAFSVLARTSQAEPPGPPVLARVVSPPPDRDLWQAVFDPTTPVEPHATDRPSRLVSTYSMAGVHDQLKAGHQAFAVNSPVTPPGAVAIEERIPAAAGFTPMVTEGLAAEPVLELARLLPRPEDDDAALSGVLQRISANMFRPDGTTDVAQRVSAAITHARALAARNTELPVLVVPETMIDGTDTVDPASHLAQLVAFTRGPVMAPPATTTLAGAAGEPPPSPPPTPAPVYDFHRYLTFLGDHPGLLRLLGLVVDLEIPVGSLPISPSAASDPRLLQVLAAFATPLQGVSISPYTAYLLEGQNESVFSAAPASDAEIVHGLLDLGPEGEYSLVQVDVQGGGLKLVNALSAPPPDQAQDGAGEAVGGLPAMRTSGVSVVRTGLAQRYVERMGNAIDNNATLEAAIPEDGVEPPVLFAEDLVRGYRFDVFDVATQAWRSLHQRTLTYTFSRHPGGPRTLPMDDEGVAQHASTQPSSGNAGELDPTIEHYIDESMVHWQGWSLSAPRPGRTIGDDGPTTVSNTAPPDLPQVDVTARPVPGTLPRLRFGARYRFRARTVDIAGNGPDLAEATRRIDHDLPLLGLRPPVLPGPTEDFTYRRFEPVVSPVLVPRAELTEGETLERLVIRSGPGRSVAEEAADLTATVAADHPVTYGATCERHLVPPKVSQHMAETTGLFDAAIGTGSGFRETYDLARKEKGRLTDTSVLDVSTGASVPLPDPGAVRVVPTNPGSAEGYVVHAEESLVLPYLPDPMSRGVALLGVPGVPAHSPAGALDGQGALSFGPTSLPPDVLAELGGSTVHLPFAEPGGEDGWPDRRPIRLVLAERTQAGGPSPRWDPQARTLTVFLGPAEQHTMRLSSYLADGDLELLGQWRWLLEASPEGTADPVAVDVALQGGRWQLTPARPVTLVHAVERPLLAPDIHVLTPLRSTGSTFCFLDGRLVTHGESTARVDLLAAWEEVVDPPGAPTVPVTANVFDIPIDLDAPADATGGEDVPVAAYDAAAHELRIQGPVPDDESGRQYLARHEFGDTHHRTVRYSALATTRFREYFPKEVAEDPARLTLTGATAEVDIPSSARPTAPDLASVVPTFAWTREQRPDGSRVSTRTGGIRVYLRRPWFSSGEGELLAVLLGEPGQYPPAEPLRTLVSHWGRDSIWGQSGPLDPPAPGAFPRAARSDSGLQLEETTDATVTAVSHEVGHDPEYRPELLYCDVAVEPTPEPYHPFVRLALARCQPSSLPGLELSRVVLADFVQVPPKRTVTVSPDPGPELLLVDVQGFSAVRSPFLALVRVSVESRTPGVDDPDLGWTPVPDDSPGVVVEKTVVNQTPILWRGHVSLPSDRTAGQFRIVVREVEPLVTDDSQGSPDPEGRLVFAETLVV